MKSPTPYTLMAERHWREFLPKMVAELEARGLLSTMLQDASEQTALEMDYLCCQFMQQGLTAQQANDQAWELVRVRYIFLTPESR